MMDISKKKISVIIPAYNEEDCVEELTKRLKNVFEQESIRYIFDVYFIENGSIDKTWEKLKYINSLDKRFKVIKLSRNFRMDGGITAGLEFVSGDACVLMAADLQDPPEMISEFLREWENGWENVYAVISRRDGTGIIRRFNSKIFYWFANSLSEGLLPKNVSDFRLVDKKVYTAVKLMQERNRFIRGLFAWSGFKSKGLIIRRPPRYGGLSNADTSKVIDLALKGIFSHSLKPLRVITLAGTLMSLLAIGILLILIWIWTSKGVPFAGFGSVMFVIFIFNSFLFLMLGILGEYIGLIYEEVKQRPNFIISETLGLESTK
jgi:dolichol-phosphate mannosyltransferase